MKQPPDLPLPPPLAPAVDSPPPSGAQRLLGQLLVIEVLLASIWIIAVCLFSGSAEAVAYQIVVTFGLIYPLHLIVSGIALWTRIKRKPSTRLSTIVLLVPWVTLPVPILLNQLNSTGPLLDSPQKLINALFLLVTLAIIQVLLRPRKNALLLPLFVLKSFGLNLLILLTTVSLYLVPIGFLVFHWGTLTQPGTSQVDGYLLAYGLGALVTYAAVSTVPATLVLGYSGLSFFQTEITAHRKWRIAQLVAALPLVLIGGGLFVTLWLRTW